MGRKDHRSARRWVCLVVIMGFLLIGLPGMSYCYAADTKLEMNLEYLTSFSSKDHDIDTVSLHVLEKIAEAGKRSVYRGITVSRATGHIMLDQQSRDSSAVGIGPVYMVRYGKPQTGKLTAALDLSAGFIVYDKVFPAGGRHYNFMWRLGPQFIYKFDEDSSVNIGYMVSHVSNGFKSHNPGYDAHGVTLGFVKKF